MNVEIGQHLEEKIAEEAEGRRLDSMEYESEGDIEGDAYYMNVTVDFTMAETDKSSLMLWLRSKVRKHFHARSATKFANQRED